MARAGAVPSSHPDVTDRPATLRARALAWLARREHSRAELARKLLPVAQAEGREAEVGPLLDWLQAQRYLSDERFAESRVNARASRLGLRRIAAELRQHGVDLPAATRDTLAATEAERARAVWSRRYAPSSDPRERARQARFLLARGFGAEVVRRIVLAGAPGEIDGIDGIEDTGDSVDRGGRAAEP